MRSKRHEGEGEGETATAETSAATENPSAEALAAEFKSRMDATTETSAAAEKPAAKSKGKAAPKAAEKPAAKSKPEPKGKSKPAEKAAEKPAAKSKGKAAEKPAETSAAEAASETEKPAETSAAAEKPAPKAPRYAKRDPRVICIIGLDTTHTHRVPVGESDRFAHPLYDDRAHDEVTDADIEGAMHVGADHEKVLVVTLELPESSLTPAFAKYLKERDFFMRGPNGGVIVECVIDGRHRVQAYREAWRITLRSGETPVYLEVEFKQNLTEARWISLRIARNGGLRREDTPMQKAELLRDYRVLRLAELATQDKPITGKAAEKIVTEEAAASFGVTTKAISQWQELLARSPAVIDAVKAGAISSTMAVDAFRGVPVDKQAEYLDAVLKRGITGQQAFIEAVKAMHAESEAKSKGRKGKGAEGDDFGGSADDGEGEEGEEGEDADANEATFKPSKKAIQKIVDAHMAGKLTARAKLPPVFVATLNLLLGRDTQVDGAEMDRYITDAIHYYQGRSVRVQGLTHAQQELRLTT